MREFVKSLTVGGRAWILILVLLVPHDTPAVWALQREGGQTPDEEGRLTAHAPTTAAPTLPLLFFNAAEVHGVDLSVIKTEVAAIFSAIGVTVEEIDVSLVSGPDAPGRYNVAVSFVLSRPSTWGRAESIMGITGENHGPVGSHRSVLVFVPSVIRTLGKCSGGRHGPAIDRALARVAVHEIVHVLAPGYGHSRSVRSLLNGAVNCTLLMQQNVGISAEAAEAVRTGLEEVTRRWPVR